MPKINLTRGASAVTVRRDKVAPGQIFAMVGRDGKLGRNYAHIGMNGRMYSVRLDTGELSSSDNDGRNVTVVGSFKYTLSKKAQPGVVRECRRSEVRSGEYFQSNAGDRIYMHLGAVSHDHTGFLSVPLDNTENHAVAKNANGRVSVLGTFTLDATITK